jgi:hypothetical protein
MSQSEHGIAPVTLVVITGDEPEHHYVANRVLAEFDVAAIIVDRGRPQSRVDRIQYLLEKYSASEMLSRVLLRVSATLFRDERNRRHDLLRVLGPEASAFARPDLVSYVDGINTDAGRGAVFRAAPDVLLIYGTGIVGRRVLSMPSRVALNLHTGMSPQYRGADCAFWPLHNHEFRLIGATVHECTAQVDGGEIYGRERARVRPGDGQFAVFARCVEVGAELVVMTLHEAPGGRLTGVEQDPSVGREYRAADKRLRHDLSVRWLFRSGKARRLLESTTAVRGTT